MITTFLDAVEALCYSILLIIWWPASVMKFKYLARIGSYLRVLVPNGMLSLVIQSFYDLRRRNYDRACLCLENIISSLEELQPKGLNDLARVQVVLTDLYALLARSHLYRGFIGQTALTVIRAHRRLGIERLPGLEDFDIKIAQIVKAAITAGRVLGDGHLNPGSFGMDNIDEVAAPSMSSSENQVSSFPVGHTCKVIPFPSQLN